MHHETYYLSSMDSVQFELVRECAIIRRLAFHSGKECALVRLSPGVTQQNLDFFEESDTFVLSNRHEGMSLFPILEYPCFVFICRINISNIKIHDAIDKSDVEVIGWGELYRTRVDAQRHTIG
jgi:hypothetical protein